MNDDNDELPTALSVDVPNTALMASLTQKLRAMYETV